MRSTKSKEARGEDLHSFRTHEVEMKQKSHQQEKASPADLKRTFLIFSNLLFELMGRHAEYWQYRVANSLQCNLRKHYRNKHHQHPLDWLLPHNRQCLQDLKFTALLCSRCVWPAKQGLAQQACMGMQTPRSIVRPNQHYV